MSSVPPFWGRHERLHKCLKASRTYLGKVSGLVDERAALRVRASGADLPEDRAEVNGAVVIRVDEGVRVRLRARAVVREAAVVALVQVLEVREHGAVAARGVRAEPGRVARRRARVRGEVAVRV